MSGFGCTAVTLYYDKCIVILSFVYKKKNIEYDHPYPLMLALKLHTSNKRYYNDVYKRTITEKCLEMNSVSVSVIDLFSCCYLNQVNEIKLYCRLI